MPVSVQAFGRQIGGGRDSRVSKQREAEALVISAHKLSEIANKASGRPAPEGWNSPAEFHPDETRRRTTEDEAGPRRHNPSVKRLI